MVYVAPQQVEITSNMSSLTIVKTLLSFANFSLLQTLQQDLVATDGEKHVQPLKHVYPKQVIHHSTVYSNLSENSFFDHTYSLHASQELIDMGNYKSTNSQLEALEQGAVVQFMEEHKRAEISQVDTSSEINSSPIENLLFFSLTLFFHGLLLIITHLIKSKKRRKNSWRNSNDLFFPR